MRSVLMLVALVSMSLACDSLSGDKPPVAPQERVTMSTTNELLPGIPSKGACGTRGAGGRGRVCAG